MNNSQDGFTIACERIAREAEEKTGFLDLGNLGLTTFPEDLFRLSHLQTLSLGKYYWNNSGELNPASENLRLNDLQKQLTLLAQLPRLRTLFLCGFLLSDLSPLSGLADLQSVNCFDTQVTDLSPLSGLANLQSVYCFRTQVSDLSPLSGLANLQEVDCSDTQVTDLSPLSGLTNLQSVNCSGTQVTDLSPLSGLANLQSVYCFGTQVTDLSPLSGLANLQSVNCASTQVIDLSPLSGLANLQEVDCFRTQVSDLSPLSGLVNLQEVDCSDTQVTDLSPLSGLANLQSVNCSGTQVIDLSPLSGLANLQEVDCSGTQVTDLSPLAEHTNLETLYAYKVRIPTIPEEVLSQEDYDDCLERLRAHLKDLVDGEATVYDLKLMVLGNGRVGKTQICRQLQGASFDTDVSSTHGIMVSSATLSNVNGEQATKLHLWDFGGQDIYHGTHALFMRTRAIFLLVWTVDAENSATHEHDGFIFRNHPLPYWLAYVRNLGEANSPLLVVQTQCDRPEDDVRRLPVTDDALEGFGYCKPQLHFSSQTGRGRAALDETLREAVLWLREQKGYSYVGAGRMRVQRRLEEMRDEDAKVLVVERKYRTLTQEYFRQICDEEGGVSSPDHLLDYLHNIGLIFYRQGLFQDRIILDQGWALEAVYAVFNREKCYRHLRHAKGRFTRSILEVLVWQEYSREEQQLFLSMMESCGVCFVHSRGSYHERSETEYIAPELLPAWSEIAAELDEKWDPHQPMEKEIIEFELLHPGLLSCLVANIGVLAGINGLYWKEGVCVWEKHTQSHALIEQECRDDWHGIIRVRTQGKQPKLLLERLLELIDKEQDRFGFRRRKHSREQPRQPLPQSAIKQESAEEERLQLEFTQQPKPGTEYCVSYAWGDTSKEGRAREQLVDQLCIEAKKRGIIILRDTSVLGLGDSITRFMNRISQADRVFVVLSDKYLRSPYCMYELYEVWQYSRRKEDDFLQRIRIYTLPCAKIFSLSDRLDYSRHWMDEFSAVEVKIKQLGAAFIGETVLKKFRLMHDFAKHVGDILETLADIVQPRTFEELKEYGLDDIDPKI